MTGLKQTEKSRTCAVVGIENIYHADSETNEQDARLLKNRLRQLMERIITEHNCREFISGMNPGAELLGAELAIDFKENYPIAFWGILSSEEQWIHWSSTERDRFFSLMEKADYEYRAANKKTDQSRSAQLKIIEEEADILIVVADSIPAEIRQILILAVKKGKKIYQVRPSTAEVSEYLKLL